MKVRAKFRVSTVELHERGQRRVKASPVYSSNPESENYSFSEATPQGSLDILVTRPGAMADFQPGVEFYLDLTPCTDEAAQ